MKSMKKNEESIRDIWKRHLLNEDWKILAKKNQIRKLVTIISVSVRQSLQV
jgi:hypothetical protein